VEERSDVSEEVSDDGIVSDEVFSVVEEVVMFFVIAAEAF